MLTASYYGLVEWHNNRYVSLIRYMNFENVLSKEYISFYACVNYDDIMLVI
jgi:hypothetical protein